MLTMLFYCTGI